MHTTTAAADQPASTPDSASRSQRGLTLDPAYPHHGAQEITIWGVLANSRFGVLASRCSISIESGSTTTHLYPTPEEMRTLAALLLQAAEA